jgi:hypothetical protein
MRDGLDPAGEPIDLLAVLRKGTKRGLINRPIWIARKSGAPLALRLVAVKKPPQAAGIARRKARQESVKGRHQISKGTLAAAEWVILVTSLASKTFPAIDVLALYRLRWRIDRLRRSAPALQRHLHEPPRRRDYQRMTRLF